jgi:hypothetical protein
MILGPEAGGVSNGLPLSVRSARGRRWTRRTSGRALERPRQHGPALQRDSKRGNATAFESQPREASVLVGNRPCEPAPERGSELRSSPKVGRMPRCAESRRCLRGAGGGASLLRLHAGRRDLVCSRSSVARLSRQRDGRLGRRPRRKRGRAGGDAPMGSLLVANAPELSRLALPACKRACRRNRPDRRGESAPVRVIAVVDGRLGDQPDHPRPACRGGQHLLLRGVTGVHPTLQIKRKVSGRSSSVPHSPAVPTE